MDYYCSVCKTKGRNDYTTNFYENKGESSLIQIEDPILHKKVLLCEECLKFYNGFGLGYFMSSINEKYKEFKEENLELYSHGIAQKKMQEQFKENEAKYKEIAQNMLLSTVTGFEGYSIQEYTGIVTSHIVLGTGILSEIESQFSDVIGTNSNLFEDKLSKAKKHVLENIKLEAATKGANGLIGISFDIEITKTNMFIVSVTATSVRVTKTDI